MSLKQLLQDADPFVRESTRSDSDRERVRSAVLRGARDVSPVAPTRRRFALAITAASVLLGAVVLGYAVWGFGTPVSAAMRFEVRLAEEQPAPGLVVAQAGSSKTLIYLHPEIVVNNDDVVQSWVSEDGPGFSVSVQFVPAGGERMRRATASHIGRPMAVLIDGVVVMAPTVRGPVGELGMITGGFTRAQAEKIADGILTR
jgi:hypothetical protein